MDRIWRLSAHESAMPRLQSRYPSPQPPNLGERNLCSHPCVERKGNCATFADIARIGRGRHDAVAIARENSPVGARRRDRCWSAGAKLHVLLFPCFHEHFRHAPPISISVSMRVRDNPSLPEIWWLRVYHSRRIQS
jgi:hypothetical protein